MAEGRFRVIAGEKTGAPTSEDRHTHALLLLSRISAPLKGLVIKAHKGESYENRARRVNMASVSEALMIISRRNAVRDNGPQKAA